MSWGNCSRCFDYEIGERINPWEFVCSSCVKDEEWIQGIAALVRDYEEPNGTDRSQL